MLAVVHDSGTRGERRGVAGKARWQRDHAASGDGGILGLTRVLEHALEARHVDHAERERASAQGVDAILAVAVAQTQELVGLSQLDPWHRTTEQPLGEG